MENQRSKGLPDQIGTVLGINVMAGIVCVLGFAFWSGAT